MIDYNQPEEERVLVGFEVSLKGEFKRLLDARVLRLSEDKMVPLLTERITEQRIFNLKREIENTENEEEQGYNYLYLGGEYYSVKRYKEALHCWKEASKYGDAMAMFNVG